MGILDFNASTAYADDYQYADDLTDAKYYRAAGEYEGLAEPATGQAVKINRHGVDSGEYRIMAQAIALMPEDMVVALWDTSGNIAEINSEDHLLIDRVRWKVLSARRPRRSFWVLALRRGAQDA